MWHVYRKLAWTNLKNNRRLQAPYAFIGMMIVAMFYTMLAFVYNPSILEVRGGNDVAFVLLLGSVVIGIFSVVFLFYTNSFLMKQRKKELGVYNILGMEKRHIAKVLFLESVVLSTVSVVGGIVVGMLFQRLLMLVLFKLIGTEAVVRFHISGRAVLSTVLLFSAIYCLTYIYNLLQVKLANPIELLRSKNAGEKEPKTKLVMTFAGLAALLAGYYMALTTVNAIAAVNQFFQAVILVIIGTYFLFVAGSIALLKGLRKNRKFYYHSRRFIAVSGMLYRMKQNAVGLSNICILSTMILLILSTTVSTYIGTGKNLENAYDTELNVNADFTGSLGEAARKGEQLEERFLKALQAQGENITKNSSFFYFLSFAVDTKTAFEFVPEMIRGQVSAAWDNSVLVYFMTRETAEVKNNISLGEIPENEVTVVGTKKIEAEKLCLFGKEYAVHDSLCFSESGVLENYITGVYYCVVEDEEALEELHEDGRVFFGDTALEYQYEWQLDMDGTKEEKLKAYSEIRREVSEYTGTDDFFKAIVVSSRQNDYAEFLQLNGGLLFLGLFLGIMFLMAMVMIIYYKQISEGYEDRERFQIMEKVGMSNGEAKRTINTQVRMVFFLPLVTAVVHVIVSFPMMKYLLAILNLYDTMLFIYCIIGTVLVFGIIYYVVFRITSKSYCRIVGEQTV